MKRIHLNLKDYSSGKVEEIASYFKKGDVVAYPTDTVYGLGCLATNNQVIKKVHEVKGTSQSKPLIVLIKDLKMLKKYANISQEQENYLNKLWVKGAKPTTVILQARNSLLSSVSSKENTIAVRLPDTKFLQDLLSELNQPIVSTSLNITGQPVLSNLKKVEEYFGHSLIDILVDSDKIVNEKSSIVIDIRNIKEIIVLRK